MDNYDPATKRLLTAWEDVYRALRSYHDAAECDDNDRGERYDAWEAAMLALIAAGGPDLREDCD